MEIRKLVAPVLTVVLLAAVLVGGLKLKSLFDSKLAIAQEHVITAEHDAVIAEKHALGAEERASLAQARADSAEAVATAATERAHVMKEHFIQRSNLADSLATLAPVECDTALAAMAEARDIALGIAGEYQAAFQIDSMSLVATRAALDSTTTALRDLRVSSEILRGASIKLVHQSKGGFFGAIIPKLGVGGAVGIDPQTGKFSKTVGLALGWTF